MQLWHVTYASPTRHALFPGESLRRAALRRLLRVVEAEIVLYSPVDDHVHLVLFCSDERAALLGRAVRLALRALAVGEVGPADRRPVDGRSHMDWLVRSFLLQVEKHQIAVHPAIWAGSCFQELIGARPSSGLVGRLAKALPRLRRATVCQIVGVSPMLAAISDEQLRALGAGRPLHAVTASLLVGPELVGKGAGVMLAKRVYAQAGLAVGMRSRELGEALDVAPDRLKRWAAPAVAPALLRAARVRLTLEEAVAALAVERRIPKDVPEVPR